MHLLAAKPGGFVDDEGIIDLNQTAGDIIIMAAADSLLSALAQGAQQFRQTYKGQTLPTIRLANWMQLLKPAAFDLYEDKVLEHASVVLVSFLGGKHYWPYGYERLVHWAEAKTGRTLILVPGDDAPDPDLQSACQLTPNHLTQAEYQVVWRYLRHSGPDNIKALLHYLWSRLPTYEPQIHDKKAALLPPKELGNCLIYRNGTSISLAQWRQCFPHANSVCLVIFYRSHLQSGNTAMFDALIDILQQQALTPLAVAVTSLKDDEVLEKLNVLLEQTKVQIVLNTTGFATNKSGSNSDNKSGNPALGAAPTAFDSVFNRSMPVLQLILSSSTEEDWHAQTQGLRHRDMAMQIVLPELDGRIITRAISFKTMSHYDDACQIDLVRYAIQPERATFVAQLAKAYIRLATKTNKEKRIALMLANYPTKDGRIGNGVGLDTPASTVHILQALARSGYSIDELPANGDDLIQTLLGSITNNPNTLHYLGCWQSLAIDDYKTYFALLPASAQQAVIERWGQPEEDHKCRWQDGVARIMLAGIRLGDIFVGIQPARGFNLDLVANYHDPDLVPPHSYLAYYFWLRHIYQVDAIIHVGKHGNLEWLPGKGAALSDQCWPDIALGPTPHFYPFIVNDPGEGAQAKRRTQAAIIDHLMPPMTRAESYGELLELENLVDEYYQALGMDKRREEWLKAQIIALVKKSHLLEELEVSTQGEVDQDDALLMSLDTYLCEIKDAQIRYGLHRLGQLPALDKLADTLVALLRLPRGKEPQDMGIIQALAQDFGFLVPALDFNPMAVDVSDWHGPQPEVLQMLDSASWRTHADTKERLERCAVELIKCHLLSMEQLFSVEQRLDMPQHHLLNERELQANYPATHLVLQQARHMLIPALQQSAMAEIDAIITGLNAGFIPPGPSGAPTRGRLDTLPTGRNFFSVDNRAIPSAAAWALGEKSAQALIERHLQKHGDYPRTLGLSVWGTATMRTGGDDIAQALALMGVRPVWAEGSNRVVDIEVIPCMLLGRPRVDVTLRVSGFFRDAFANVMRLYQKAVEAIAAYEEPGQDNTIRANIESQTKKLQQQGMSLEQARQQASYRVFGSKPGAYGAGLQGLIDEGCWDTSADLAEAYVNWGGYAYGVKNAQGHFDGIEAKNAFVHQLSQLEAVVQNQDNREHDLLDSDDYYQFQGGMTNAVRAYGHATPEVYHNDHSNPAIPKVRTLQEELNRVIRSRVLNPKWIHAMQEHGYKGAFEMAATVDYLFAYDATTDLVADYQYEKICDTLLFDSNNQAFLRQANPNALEEMAERLLEACQRGMWQDEANYAERLQDLLLDLDQQQEQAN
ncbi:cobaltochelatase subunit CobN [Marinomonas agarivorans]|nr:cobaltochelatase subunit CobN [Marinomonas agarivorans]